MRKGIKILVKVISTLLLVAIFLPLLAALLLHLEGVQSRVVERVALLASEKLGTTVSVDRLKIGFFNRLEVEGVYVEDFDRDTLLYASQVEASIARLGILSAHFVFDEVLLRYAKFHLRESSRGVMNVK